ncbi:MAG TPA: SDR family oxidoreductase [Fimbriimonadales bacterium]|nr:SDR family oxidoreductase [Fimbriimonadales bacterium]
MADVCVVTGAGSGIGRATCLALAKRGVSIIMGGRNTERLESTAEECKGVNVRCSAGDVGNPDYTDSLFQYALELREKSSKLLAVFAAGVAHFGPTLEQEHSLWEQTLRTNLTGIYNACRSAIRAMLPIGGGRIVNVLSTASKIPFPESAAYVASKYGALGLTRSLNAEFRKKGILLTAFLPGSSATNLWEAQPWSPPREDMLDPRDVGEMIAYIVTSPPTYNVDEIVFMPPKGVL